jgi:hypothetical protein
MTRVGPWTIAGGDDPQVDAVLAQVVGRQAAVSGQLDAAVSAFYAGARGALSRGVAGEGKRAGLIVGAATLPLLAAVVAVGWMLHVWPEPRPPTEALFKLLFGTILFFLVFGTGTAVTMPVLVFVAARASGAPDPTAQVAAILAVARGQSLVGIARQRGWSPEDLHRWGQAWLDAGVQALTRRP